MSAPDVYREVSRDKIFYEDGGGVTVSGGEPLAHACFVKELFELCKEGGISTCLETSGFADKMNLEMLLPLTDHILFDIKLLDSEKHWAYTGQPNGRILENAKVAAQSGVDIVFRIPLIPKVNDDGGNIAETAKFIKGIVAKPQVQLMPYHRMGDSKYTALNITNVMREVDTMPPESVEAVRRRFEDSGVECSISR
jgi:pyruvate formate lyase activating enzyme